MEEQQNINGVDVTPIKLNVRILTRLYWGVAGGLSLIALLLLNFHHDEFALIALALGWILIPLIAYLDRMVFDGHALRRSGPMAFVLKHLFRQKLTLGLDEIEWVETEALRTLRRGGTVRYRYRTEIAGARLRFAFASGTGSYRKMVAALFPLISPEKLDTRSLELRDYLRDARSLRVTRDALRIAPSAVLDDSSFELQPELQAELRHIIRHQRSNNTNTLLDAERGRHLRSAANELRIAGRLREAGEAFRRALLAMPSDSWLIYDFARYLFSQASASGNAALAARSNAALRLAARRAEKDYILLARIGESFAERGELTYATKLFNRSLELQPDNFRASIGLAEISLRTAKLAHVVHHYGAAARTAPDSALAQYAQREADYYALLNTDDEYLAVELNRINLLQQIQQAGRMAARVTFIAVAFALVASFVEESFATVGWSLACSAAVIWICVSIAARFFHERRPSSGSK